MPNPLDTKLCQELASHIEDLTHTGQKTLNVDVMKNVKKICKSGDGYVGHAYHLLLHQLNEQHAEVRFSAFQVIDELFRRSHCFRELLVSDLQRIMELTAETSPDLLLPSPKVAANNLKRLALQSFHEWNLQYGSGYKKLQLGYHFLKKCKNIDFSNMEFENAIEQARTQERLRHQKLVNEEKLKRVLSEYNDLYNEIRDAIKSMKNCIELLVPSLDDFFITQNADNSDEETVENPFLMPDTGASCSKQDSEEEGEDEEESNIIREHGMLNTNFTVEVQVNHNIGVKETPENTAIFENARDLRRLIQNRHIPSVKTWLQIITKCSGKAEDTKKMVDLKEELEKCLKNCDRLNIQLKDAADDSSDSDFEDVPDKEGYEENVVDYISPCAEPMKTSEKLIQENKKDWEIFSQENNERDPTTILSTLNTLENVKSQQSSNKEKSQTKSSTTDKQKLQQQREELECIPSTSGTVSVPPSRKEKLLSVAPKLPFDIDLYHWEEENLKAPTMLLVKPDGARFWSATSTDEMDEIAVPEGTASLRTRVIEFSGQHEPVKWACRAPLASGKLCPRRDRQKCPFHGPIVPRDNTGKCTNPEDEQRLKKLDEEHQLKFPDWQDPKLLQEIKDATGIDLKIPEKGKRKKKTDTPKYPGLTDIKAKQNNAYTRIAKKVFKKSTVKRVAQNLDKADHKRFRDKYGDQFNYVHDTS